MSSQKVSWIDGVIIRANSERNKLYILEFIQTNFEQIANSTWEVREALVGINAEISHIVITIKQIDQDIELEVKEVNNSRTSTKTLGWGEKLYNITLQELQGKILSYVNHFAMKPFLTKEAIEEWTTTNNPV